MGKKKKKSSASSPSYKLNKTQQPATPTDSKADFLPRTNCLSVRVSSDKRCDTTSPTVVVSIQDARRIDLVSNELVLLISLMDEEERDFRLRGALVWKANIREQATLKTPEKGIPVKSSNHLPGTIKLSPPSACTTLFSSKQSVECDESEKDVLAVGPPPTLVTPLPSTPSSPFSFRSEDASFSSNITPSKSSSKKKPNKDQTCWIIPVMSDLGDALCRQLCRKAKSATVRIVDHSLKQTFGSESIVKRVVLAQLRGRHVQLNEILTISIQGRPVPVEIVGATEIPEIERCATHMGLGDDDRASFEGAEEFLLFGASSSSIRLYEVQANTTLELAMENTTTIATDTVPPRDRNHVVGLDATLEAVKSFLRTPLCQAEAFSMGSLSPPRGLLLHGPSGVGKSCLAKQLTYELGSLCVVEYVNCIELLSKTSFVGQAERVLGEMFETHGGASLPRLLILDDIHLICPRRSGRNPGTDRLAATLLALIDGIDRKEENLVLLAICRDPSALDAALRRPGRIDEEVEVPIPHDPATRAKILCFHASELGVRCDNINDDAWMELAKMAKGFNGADCMLAVKEAIRSSVARDAGSQQSITYSDLESAVKCIKPTSIKSVTVEIPQVLWSSIGGMESVKLELQEAVEAPWVQGDMFDKLGVPTPRGILLYGPPGCSKTLMARALATEGKMNFLAVKGPELLSKWLGESERALASLFRRARMASPAIIFFDEIDAIATKRGSGDSASSSRLLSQLLTELDGVNNTGSAAHGKTQRVLVVGATNRPDLLDSALTRPGRIDRMIYVGIPDAGSRRQIFKLNLDGRAVSGDVDVDQLAQDDVTHGYSGAEIVAICRNAALLALEEADCESIELPVVAMRHLTAAVEGMPRQITSDMIEFYSSFQDKAWARH